jgi:hypothetical protein
MHKCARSVNIWHDAWDLMWLRGRPTRFSMQGRDSFRGRRLKRRRSRNWLLGTGSAEFGKALRRQKKASWPGLSRPPTSFGATNDQRRATRLESIALQALYPS